MQHLMQISEEEANDLVMDAVAATVFQAAEDKETADAPAAPDTRIAVQTGAVDATASSFSKGDHLARPLSFASADRARRRSVAMLSHVPDNFKIDYRLFVQKMMSY